MPDKNNIIDQIISNASAGDNKIEVVQNETADLSDEEELCRKAEALSDEGNKEEAFKLWLAAAEYGGAFAQFNVGYCYLEGLGTDCDEVKAAK